VKRRVNGFAWVAFIPNREDDLEVAEKATEVVETASRQTNMSRVVLRARKDARLPVRRQSHRLGPVELRVLKRRQPNKLISKPWAQLILRDVNLIAEDQFDRVWQLTVAWRNYAPTRRRRRPLLVILLVAWKAKTNDVTSALAFGDNRLDLGPTQFADGGQKSPLIEVWDGRFIDEHAVTAFASMLLKGSAMRFPNPPRGNVSWLEKKRSYDWNPISGRRSIDSVRTYEPSRRAKAAGMASAKSTTRALRARSVTAREQPEYSCARTSR
jgi:hypothetical protein